MKNILLTFKFCALTLFQQNLSSKPYSFRGRFTFPLVEKLQLFRAVKSLLQEIAQLERHRCTRERTTIKSSCVSVSSYQETWGRNRSKYLVTEIRSTSRKKVVLFCFFLWFYFVGIFLIIKKKTRSLQRLLKPKHKATRRVPKYLSTLSQNQQCQCRTSTQEKRAFSAPLADFPPNFILKAFPSFFIWSKRNNLKSSITECESWVIRLLKQIAGKHLASRDAKSLIPCNI